MLESFKNTKLSTKFVQNVTYDINSKTNDFYISRPMLSLSNFYFFFHSVLCQRGSHQRQPSFSICVHPDSLLGYY